MSLPALKKALKITDATKRYLNGALKSGTEKGVLVKNKGKYKVSAEAKKAPVSFGSMRVMFESCSHVATACERCSVSAARAVPE